MKYKQCLSYCFYKNFALILKNCYFTRLKSWCQHFHVTTYKITVFIEFIKVLKWLNNCEPIIAAKVIPWHEEPILKGTSKLQPSLSNRENKWQQLLNKFGTGLSLFLNFLEKISLISHFNFFFISYIKRKHWNRKFSTSGF